MLLNTIPKSDKYLEICFHLNKVHSIMPVNALWASCKQASKHESSIGLSSTTNPKPRGSHPGPLPVQLGKPMSI